MKFHCLSKMLLFIALSCLPDLSGETKQDRDIFKKWFEYQTVFHDRSLNRSLKEIDHQFFQSFTNRYHRNTGQLECVHDFISNFVGCDVHTLDNSVQPSFDTQRNFARMYSWFELDPMMFLDYLKTSQFINVDINGSEQQADINDVLKRYRCLFKLLSNQQNKQDRAVFAFAFANRLFESCFCQNFNQFYSLLNTKSYHQIARFVYTMIWFNFVGEGWKHWHKDCLKSIKKEADAGKEIVYIAGGNDIYQLLRDIDHLNLRVIDPMLPSQPDYYAEGWDWLLKGTNDDGLGDTLKIATDRKSLSLVREKYVENGTFDANLSTGKTVTLPQSTTTWAIYDDQSHKKCGNIIFERRFCRQDDFVMHPNKAHLLSFNEMYFVAMPHELYGWGINFEKLPHNLHWHIKQLRKPVKKAYLKNLRKAESESKFSFIMLGSNAT